MQHPRPTPPSIRNAERQTQVDRRESSTYAMALKCRLLKRTAYTKAPSAQMQAWQEYEYALIGVFGWRCPTRTRAYYLSDECTKILSFARFLVTGDTRDIRQRTGFSPRTTPRRALANLAKAYGYRYTPALEMIEEKLARGAHLAKFRRERLEFRHALELSADSAHQVNDKGQSPQAVREVIKIFANELLALCPWLEVVGYQRQAQELRERVESAIS